MDHKVRKLKKNPIRKSKSFKKIFTLVMIVSCSIRIYDSSVCYAQDFYKEDLYGTDKNKTIQKYTKDFDFGEHLKAYICDTAESDYKYMSWGQHATGIDQFNRSLLESFGSVENMPEVDVAVLDTGIDYNNSILSDRMKYTDSDLVDNDSDAMDEHGHGSCVAGIIADSTLSNVKISAYRVADAMGVATARTVSDGIYKAIEDGVDIINVSLAGPIDKNDKEDLAEIKLVYEAMAKAIQNEIVVVVAAGNTASNASNVWPANYEDAITVSAIDKNDEFAFFSNYGKCIDICAPGSMITSTSVNNMLSNQNGTSMAAPFISSAAAMLLTYNNNLTCEEITDYLYDTAQDLGDKGYDTYYGNGKLDLSSVMGGKVKIKSHSNTSQGYQLKWSKVYGAKGYYLYRKTTSGSYKKIATLSSGKKTYTDTTAKNGTEYTYKLVAYNASRTTAKTIKNVWLSKAAIKSIKNNKSKTITVTYGKNSKATGYQIEYSKKSDFSSSKKLTIKSASKVLKAISKLSKNKTYYFRIRSYKKLNGKTYYGVYSSKKNKKVLK